MIGQHLVDGSSSKIEVFDYQLFSLQLLQFLAVPVHSHEVCILSQTGKTPFLWQLGPHHRDDLFDLSCKS